MRKKLKIGILFGGRSAEHEVSIQSAKNVVAALDKNKYEPVLIGIDKKGIWHTPTVSQALLEAENPRLLKLNNARAVTLATEGSSTKLISISNGQKQPPIDVIFPVLHGTFGEDGTMQGLLKLANIPFVGAGVLGSAVGMDKDVMKRLLHGAGIRIAKFIVLTKSSNSDFNNLKKALGLPFFVKPANLGSSVGVRKVKTREEFLPALKEAFQYDTKVLIEEYIPGREIECSVLGNEDPIASLPGEVIPAHEFYSYDAKYIDENGARLEIPAKLSKKSIREIKSTAVKAFTILCCAGMARVDFFLKKDGAVVLNEINTIPGFTKISMYPKLWEVSGISYTNLIDRLIQLALERHRREQQLKTSFQ